MGEFRIIAGKWRGRRLRFPNVNQLRPTTDRTRETVFNWLMPIIIDAHCLDGFAGSGALGLEALSRGAAHVTFIDNQHKLTQTLAQHVDTLDCADQTQIVTATFASYVSQRQSDQLFDIVFLDPPFFQNNVQRCIDSLQQYPCLANNAYVYIETEKTVDLTPCLPANWQITRQHTAGHVAYYLISVS